MPHECTSCGRAFEDGAQEMLSGCPTCGGNRFQYVPEAESADRDRSGGDLIEADPDPAYDPDDTMWDAMEDRAQTDARRDIVDPDTLPEHEAPDETDDGSRPDLQELREELEDQFGSIKIVDRGEYELNLMELYERRECIIELQENGRYAIQVPEAMTSPCGTAEDVPNR